MECSHIGGPSVGAPFALGSLGNEGAEDTGLVIRSLRERQLHRYSTAYTPATA